MLKDYTFPYPHVHGVSVPDYEELKKYLPIDPPVFLGWGAYRKRYYESHTEADEYPLDVCFFLKKDSFPLNASYIGIIHGVWDTRVHILAPHGFLFQLFYFVVQILKIFCGDEEPEHEELHHTGVGMDS